MNAGKITISKPMNIRDEGESVSIELIDAGNHVVVLKIEVPLLLFAGALFGHGYQDCEFQLIRPELVGWRSEHKSVEILVPDLPKEPGEGYRAQQERIARLACAPYEVDGWTAHYDDCSNRHRRVRSDEGEGGVIQQVHFHRFLPPEPEA